MNPIHYFKSLRPLGKAVVIAALVLLALLAWNFVGEWFRGNIEVKAKIEGKRSDAAVESGREALDRLGELADRNAETQAKVGEIEAQIEDARTPEEADRIARDGLCEIDPQYCEGNN